MELILTRIAKKKDYTIGHLFQKLEARGEIATPHSDQGSEKLENSSCAEEIYLCDTLEPTWRDYAHGGRKIKGHSAIPEGRYAVVISYSPKFKQWLPILLGVPNFSGIRIHAGNTAKDTEGCILVGENKVKGQLINSRETFQRLYAVLKDAANRRATITITIV